MSEDDFTNGIQDNNMLQTVRDIARKNSAVLPICAQIEMDIVDMDNEEKELFLC